MLIVSALGTAIIHFLWQGVVIGVIAAVMMRALRDQSAHVRYVCATLLLACLPATFAATFLASMRFGAAGGSDVAAIAAAGPSALATALVWAWAAGAALMAGRFGLQWCAARRLRRRGVAPVDGRTARLFELLRVELGVSRRVRLLESCLAPAPMVIGWLSPVVLAPASALTSLSHDQLRAVLAHELAHIRRCDHWVNALQSVVEIVLFFHPVVWRLSKRVRLEREHCCDDIAVAAAGDPLILAKALSNLAALREEHPQIALAANGGPLMNRITRMLGVSAAPGPVSWRFIVGCGAAVALAWVGATQAAVSTPPDPVVQLLRTAVELGAISDEQAREVYRIHVYSRLDEAAELDAKAHAASEHIGALIEAGELSREEATKKLDAIDRHRELYEATRFAMDVRGESKAEAYRGALTADLEAQVEAGVLTAAEAEKKLAGFLVKQEQHARLTDHYLKIKEEIEFKVAAGEMSVDEARLHLAAMKKEIQARVEAQQVQRKEKAHIEALIEAGQLSKVEAAHRAESLRELWRADPSKQNVVMAEQQRRAELEAVLARAAAELKASVASGELTREEAHELLQKLMHGGDK